MESNGATAWAWWFQAANIKTPSAGKSWWEHIDAFAMPNVDR